MFGRHVLYDCLKFRISHIEDIIVTCLTGMGASWLYNFKNVGKLRSSHSNASMSKCLKIPMSFHPPSIFVLLMELNKIFSICDNCLIPRKLYQGKEYHVTSMKPIFILQAPFLAD